MAVNLEKELAEANNAVSALRQSLAVEKSRSKGLADSYDHARIQQDTEIRRNKLLKRDIEVERKVVEYMTQRFSTQAENLTEIAVINWRLRALLEAEGIQYD